MRNPHGASASTDVFNLGLIRSDTDYDVYKKRGLKGLDFAFYRARSRYHTMYDSVSSLDGKASLWAMMDTARESGNALVNDLSTAGNDDSAVYFDGALINPRVFRCLSTFPPFSFGQNNICVRAQNFLFAQSATSHPGSPNCGCRRVHRHPKREIRVVPVWVG